jgi:hypothetical protein
MDWQDVLMGTVGGAALAIFGGPAIAKHKDRAVRQLSVAQAKAMAKAMEEEFPELAGVASEEQPAQA